MADFNINKGESKNLPTAIKEGSVYVTTDEGGLYVDIDNTERLKIADASRTAFLYPDDNEDVDLGDVTTEMAGYASKEYVDNNFATTSYVDNNKEIFIGAPPVTTWKEIEQAYNNNKIIILNQGSLIYQLNLYIVGEDGIVTAKFTSYNPIINSQYQWTINSADKTWAWSSVDLSTEMIVHTLETPFNQIVSDYNTGKPIILKINNDDNTYWMQMCTNMDVFYTNVTSSTVSTYHIYRDNPDAYCGNYEKYSFNLLSKEELDQTFTAVSDILPRVGGGGLGCEDIQPNGTFNLVPNTILLCFGEQGKLNLKGTDNYGNEINFTGYTGCLLFATVEGAEAGKFNISGILFGGTSTFTVKLDTFRYYANSNCYLENTGTTNAAFYRDVRNY